MEQADAAKPLEVKIETAEEFIERKLGPRLGLSTPMMDHYYELEETLRRLNIVKEPIPEPVVNMGPYGQQPLY